MRPASQAAERLLGSGQDPLGPVYRGFSHEDTCHEGRLPILTERSTPPAAETARKEIVTAISAGKLVPTEYQYVTQAGAERWLQLCSSSSYGYHLRTTRFWRGRRGRRMADRALAAIDGDPLNLLSLGPGDGKKDGQLAARWVGRGATLTYFAYDVSQGLIARAAQQVREDTCDRSARVAIKRVHARFSDFPAVARHISSGRPNIVTLLGTLGNLEDERSALDLIRAGMVDEDLLILEVRLKSPSALAGLGSNTSLRHDFGPLEDFLGLEYDFDSMAVVGPAESSSSRIPLTTTHTVVYHGSTQLRQAHPVVRLQLFHQYDPHAFLATICGWGFECIDHYVDPESTFLECLLRKC